MLILEMIFETMWTIVNCTATIKEVSKFVSSDLIRAEVEEKYSDSLIKLSKDDKFYQIKLTALKTKKQEVWKRLRPSRKRTKNWKENVP